MFSFIDVDKELIKNEPRIQSVCTQPQRKNINKQQYHYDNTNQFVHMQIISVLQH